MALEHGCTDATLKLINHYKLLNYSNKYLNLISIHSIQNNNCRQIEMKTILSNYLTFEFYIEFIIERNNSQNYDNNCPICLKELSENIDENLLLAYGHLYCRCYLKNMINNKNYYCYLCKK